MADISFKIASKSWKLHKLFNLTSFFDFCIYFKYTAKLLWVKSCANEENVHNDVRKHSPIRKNLQHISERVGDIHDGEEASVFAMG